MKTGQRDFYLNFPVEGTSRFPGSNQKEYKRNRRFYCQTTPGMGPIEVPLQS
jgi:hypothetical protein